MSRELPLRESRIQKAVKIAMRHKFVCKCYHCSFWLSYQCPRCIRNNISNGRCWCYRGGINE